MDGMNDMGGMMDALKGGKINEGAKDPASLIDEIMDELQKLRDMIAPEPEEPPQEFEPQTDQEVMAGLAPKPKAKNPFGGK